jgi:hypothetical protein
MKGVRMSIIRLDTTVEIVVRMRNCFPIWRNESKKRGRFSRITITPIGKKPVRCSIICATPPTPPIITSTGRINATTATA